MIGFLKASENIADLDSPSGRMVAGIKEDLALPFETGHRSERGLSNLRIRSQVGATPEKTNEMGFSMHRLGTQWRSLELINQCRNKAPTLVDVIGSRLLPAHHSHAIDSVQATGSSCQATRTDAKPFPSSHPKTSDRAADGQQIQESARASL